MHVVNAHGAPIELREPVLAGQKAREQVTCTVADITPGTTDVPEVGMACQTISQFLARAISAGRLKPANPKAERVSSITNNNAGKPVMVKKQ